jgi:hypothetical protein
VHPTGSTITPHSASQYQHHRSPSSSFKPRPTIQCSPLSAPPQQDNSTLNYPGEHGDVVKGAPRRLISNDRPKSFELVESGSLTIITLSLKSGSNIIHRTTQTYLQSSRVRHPPLHVSAAWLSEQSLEHLTVCYTSQGEVTA